MDRDRDRPPPRREGGSKAQLSEQERKAILNGDAGVIDEVAERFGRELVLHRTQLRNFYGPLVSLRALGEDKRRRELTKHRSRVAYLVVRAGQDAMPLWHLFEGLLRTAASKEQIDAVCDLAEALVAYNRFHHP